MKRSIDRILTSHAGSLPRPDDLNQMNRDKMAGKPIDEAARTARIRESVPEVVRKQVECRVDVVNDGEYGKVNFLNYIRERLSGFEPTGESEHMGAMADNRRDRIGFEDFYTEELGGRAVPRQQLACTGPITYARTDLLQADIENFKAALQDVQVEEGFLPALATMNPGPNRYYNSEEEYEIALADAMRVEYRAIVDAGFVVQIDDPALPSFWDRYIPEPPLEDYLKVARRRVDVLNYALQGIPEDRVRYHICWGSWHGPHVSDLPLADIAGVMLTVKAQMYSIEAANVRHEHEWKVWRDTKLPEGKILMPGVVSHATNVVEHPQLVADRIETYANVVGRENVVAGTDCGLGGRVHPQICWAKLTALADGAELASRKLWT
jgi:5-methyltetrahydropteroyltriglutamate--homocysteine methyltransferase